MAGKIEDLVKNIGHYKGIASDSRNVKKGFVFVAVKGGKANGHNFIRGAVEKGAEAVVGEEAVASLPGADYFRVRDSRQALGELASAWYGYPSKKLKIIGVTGTKGKTTTVHLIYHILTGLGAKCGLVSSNTVKIGNSEEGTGFHVTSPDVLSLQKLLKKMVDVGCEYAVLEVSSHGIDQKRIAGVNFDVAVLTNIAPEHLDYHKTFKEYKRVKMSFVNSAKHKVMAPQKTDINVLPGKFNNLNVAAAVSAVAFFGIEKTNALKTLDSFKLPAGRLEEIKNDLGIKIIIDFAHTPESLEAVLKYLKEKHSGRLISVFGCAGERDKHKRFKMGRVSALLADYSVFTAEDPRTEDVHKILNKIAQGARSAGASLTKDFVKIPERGEAIIFGLKNAKKGDTVAILGKGHEKSMAFADENGKIFEHPWSDKRIIENYLKRDKGISAVVLAAGKGTRMKSLLPKVIHKICGRPMISYTLENLRSAGVGEIITVVSYKRNMVVREIEGAVKIAIQKNPKGGTADAALSGFAMVDKNADTLIVINGDDSAFYKPETIKSIVELNRVRERKLTFVSLMKAEPTGLGRVIRGKDGLITKIVEEKEANEEEKKIKEVNDGLYVFDREWFSKNISKVKKSSQGEFYLVDLIKIAIDQGDRMATYTLPDDSQWQGINTQEQLNKAIEKMTKRLQKYE